MRRVGWFGVPMLVLALMLSAVFVGAQETQYDWGDVAGFQPARTCVQLGLTLGQDLTVDTQPRYDNLDLGDNGFLSYLLEGQQLKLWISVPGQTGYLQGFADRNDLWLSLDEWYIQNLDVAAKAENGIVGTTIELPYLPPEILHLRFALTDQPISAEQLAQFSWDLGCGEV